MKPWLFSTNFRVIGNAVTNLYWGWLQAAICNEILGIGGSLHQPLDLNLTAMENPEANFFIG